MAANLFVEHLGSEVERPTKLGVMFTQGRTKTAGSSIAILGDTCGTLLQLTRLERPMM